MSTTYLMRFLDVIRGSRIAAPSKLLPVMKMPLMTVPVVSFASTSAGDIEAIVHTHHAAPRTESPTQSPMPKAHQKYGEIFINRKPRYCQLIHELLPGSANSAVAMLTTRLRKSTD